MIRFRLRYVAIMILALSFVTGNAMANLVIAEGKPTGQWYNPERDGEGFYVEVIDSDGNLQISVAMYSYDNDGNQLWLIGNVAISETATTATVPVFFIDGPFWGVDYDPDDRNFVDFGTITVFFTSCNSAIFQVRPDVDGFASGDYPLVRLTDIVGVDCNDPPPPPPPDGGGEGVAQGEWGDGGTTSCMNVAPGGRSLTSSNSPCPEGASIWIDKTGLKIDSNGDIELDFCVTNIWCTGNVNISSEGTFNCATPNNGIIEGFFTSKNEMYGYGHQSQSDLGGVCSSEWNMDSR